MLDYFTGLKEEDSKRLRAMCSGPRDASLFLSDDARSVCLVPAAGGGEGDHKMKTELSLAHRASGNALSSLSTVQFLSSS